MPALSRLHALREHVRLRAEDRPGIYRMLAGDGAVLYVGKSVRVRTRVLSYFTASEGEKAEFLMREAYSVEWEYVPNEFAALLAEMRSIQRYRPRYNVQHKREPRFCFVKLTGGLAPRLAVVTRVGTEEATYFGPFPGTRHVEEAMHELGRVLGIRDCPASTPVFFADQLEIFAGSGVNRAPRCLRGELGSCLAPCAGRPAAAEYGARVRLARRWLEGRGDGPLALLRASMADAAARLDFEYAARLRDRMEILTDFRKRLAAWRGEVDGLTFLYRVPGFRGADRLYLVRRGRVREELAYPKGSRTRARAAEHVREVFEGREPAPRGLDGNDAAEILFVANWFRTRPRELKRTRSPQEWLERTPGRAAGRARRPRSR
jgi:excinuclease ABC subunit C